MACKDVGRVCVGASQFGTATRQVFSLPASVATAVEPIHTATLREKTDPFYAARLDMSRSRRGLDVTPFIETAVTLTNADNAAIEEPLRQRRIVTMKKRG